MRCISKLQTTFLMLAWTTCLTTGLSLEQVQQVVAEKYEIFTAKINRLEAQSIKLESKVIQLEKKIEQQDSIIVALLNHHPGSVDNQLSTKVAVSRTCQELRTSDSSLISGEFLIDPDGPGVGDEPILAYCNMTTGSTAISHDSETKTSVGHCADPGCYSREIKYQATKRQLEALAELSNACHQSIKYDCLSAPLEINGITYSWWNDRDGNSQYFWSGSNSSVHTCQCGIDHNCVERVVPCNCDSSLPTFLSDDGVITDKQFLPITRLNFGRTILDTSSGLHTLGKFVCTGQAVISQMPASCKDLWVTGHTLNGLYSIMGVKQVETVHCNFTKLPSDTGFQTWIGYEDIKSKLTYFYVQKNTTFNLVNVSIPFEVEQLNVGGAMNLTSGIFTVPRTGKYFFSFTGVGRETSTYTGSLNLVLMVNDIAIGGAKNYFEPKSNDYETYSLQSTLDLKTGDRVWVSIIALLSNGYLFDDDNHYTHFTGWMLEEDIYQSLHLY